MGFDFTVKHRPGENNPADWGSRHPACQTSEDNRDDVEIYVNMITELKGIHAITLEVEREMEKDELLQKVIHAVKSNETLKKDLDMDAYANVISELSVINGLLLRGERLVMPDLANDFQDDTTTTRNHGKSCCRFLWAVAHRRILTVIYL